MTADTRQRLDAAIIAVCPIDGTSGDPPDVRIDYAVGSTPQQQADAQTVLAAFDFSQAAQDVWANTTAQATAKDLFDLLADRYSKLYRALVATLLDEINVLRGLIIGIGSVSWDAPNLANAAGATSPNITVTGAAFGDFVSVAAPASLQGLVATGYISAANTVNIRLHNSTGGAVNLASGTWTVCVRRDVAMPARTPAQARTAIRAKVDADV